MINVDSEQILKWDIEQLWNACQILEEDEETHNTHIEIIQTVKEGIKIKVPIYYLIQEWWEVYPNTKRAKILGHGKYKIQDFMEEIETRTKLMRRIIYENIDNEQATTPR